LFLHTIPCVSLHINGKADRVCRLVALRSLSARRHKHSRPNPVRTYSAEVTERSVRNLLRHRTRTATLCALCIILCFGREVKGKMKKTFGFSDFFPSHYEQNSCEKSFFCLSPFHRHLSPFCRHWRKYFWNLEPYFGT
jgi:hypothetical protein